MKSLYPSACFVSFSLTSNTQLWQSILPGHFQSAIHKSFFQSSVIFSIHFLLSSLLSIPFSPFGIPVIVELLMLSSKSLVFFLKILFFLYFSMFWNVSCTWPSRLLILISVVNYLSLVHLLNLQIKKLYFLSFRSLCQSIIESPWVFLKKYFISVWLF